MKEIKDEDFSKLYLNLHGRDSVDPVYEFKILQKHPEFYKFRGTEKLDRKRIIYYINYLYSSHSPLFYIYKDDIETRKEEAANLAGFKKDKKTEWRYVQKELFSLENEDIVYMVVKFLALQRNMVLNQIISNEQYFIELQYYILNPLKAEQEKAVYDTANTKTKFLEQQDIIRQRLDRLYDQFFQGHKDVEEKVNNDEELVQHFFGFEDVADAIKK